MIANQTQNISDERLAEKLRYAEIAEAAYVKSGLNPEAELWREDVSLLRELTALRASHKRVVEALEELIFASSGLVAGAYLQDARSALADARKLEGE